MDCIYEGARSLYFHPDECIDCGACEPVCPVEAISYESDVPARWEDFIDDNARFFHRPLPGASEMVGSPGGSMNLGRVGVDTELVGGYRTRIVRISDRHHLPRSEERP